MLDFRKVLLAAAVAGLGLVGTASAQVACTTAGAGNFLTPTTAGSATGIRIEGTTEQIAPIIINTCTGTPNNTSMSLTVNLSVPVTNAQLTGQTTGTNVDSWAVAVGFTATPFLATGSSTPGSSSITYTFGSTTNPVLTAGAVVPATTQIVIYNVRVNPSGLPAPNTAITFTSSGSTALIAPTTTTTIAYAQTSLNKATFNGFANLALCNVATTDVNAVGFVGIKEAIINGLTTDVDESTKETSAYATAAALVGVGAPAFPTNDPIQVGATTGSRIAVTFGNLSAGVTYYLPVTVTTGGLTLNLISGPTAGPGAAILAGGSIGGASNKGNTLQPAIPPPPAVAVTPAVTTVTGVYGFSPTAGTFTAYYSVGADNTGAIDSENVAAGTLPETAGTYAGITLFEVTSSTTVPATGAPTVSVYLVGNTAGFAQFLAPSAPTVVTASASTSIAVTNGTTAIAAGTGGIGACNTTMVFPYIINTGGYDTGIALTNAGLGSSVSGNTVASTAGTCTMSLWGAASLNGTAVTPFALAPVNVAAGQVTAFTLSGALAGTANASGFAGYAIASCNFQGGHGFAFLTDGFGTTPGRGLSQGYLAPILSDIYQSAYATLNAPF